MKEKKISDEEFARRQRFWDLPDGDKCFIAFTGLPRKFHSLTEAEEWAGEKTGMDHEDRTILVVPKASIEHSGVVVRYKGVVLHALHEIEDGDG